jgi:hypothetical protein
VKLRDLENSKVEKLDLSNNSFFSLDQHHNSLKADNLASPKRADPLHIDDPTFSFDKIKSEFKFPQSLDPSRSILQSIKMQDPVHTNNPVSPEPLNHTPSLNLKRFFSKWRTLAKLSLFLSWRAQLKAEMY